MSKNAIAGNGISPIALRRFNRELERSNAVMRGYTLLRGGKKIAEQYWEPYTADDKNWVYSISKSFTSTAAGLLFDEGLLDLDARVISFFPEETPEHPSENLQAMRVRHLLSMNTGHGKDTTVAVIFSGSWETTFLNLPIDHEPGTHFLYNTGASYMMSAIIQKITGQTVIEYLTPRLFAPLGFENYAGDLNPDGVFTGGWGMMVRIDDLAKLGQVYLGKGVYGGKRILSEEWVGMATSIQSDNSSGERANEPSDWQTGYGFQIWVCSHDCYRFDGAFGQFCVMMPEHDAVLALMSEIPNMQEIMDIIWATLLPGFTSTSSKTEETINGRPFKIKRNFEDVETITLRFEEDALTFSMVGGDGDADGSLRCGRASWLDGVCTLPVGERSLIPFFSLEDTPKLVSSYFHWTDETTLELNWVYRETPHRERLVCRFEGSSISVLCHSSVSEPREEDDEDFAGTME